MAPPVPPAFDPPGAGHWQLDRSHYPGGTTPISQWLIRESMPAGMSRVMEELGVPAATLDCRFVEGFMYTRLRPLVGADKPAAKLPPAFVLRLATRLHPGFRKRTAAAKRTMDERPWRGIVDQWHQRIKPELTRRNGEFQAVDLDALDDDGLAHHVDSLLGHCRATCEQHFYLHGFDLGPIGILLVDGAKWGLTAKELIPALKGASPSTAGPSRSLATLRELVGTAGPRPRSLDEVRDVSPAAAAALDDYLLVRGSLLFTRYDLDGLTLRELPDVVLSTILDGASVADAATDDASAKAMAATLRARVPEADRARFDERLAEARAAMDLRDENGPLTVEWPAGLLRFALLEVGRRLVVAGRLASLEHVFELDHDEVAPLLHDGSGPGPEEITRRSERRAAQARLDPPSTLGPVEPEPPLALLPAPLALMIATVQAVITQMGMAGPIESRPATGVGSTVYRGTARVARSAEEAVAAIEPGDVLVVPFTTPAYNVVLSLAGAVVTVHGGPLSHAAVLARELGIPAVVGYAGAMTEIPDGAMVEVDPVAGVVRVLAASNP